MMPMLSASARPGGSLKAATSRPGRFRGRLPGERGFLLVPVVGVEPFLRFGGRKDQFVAAEELHEPGPVLRINGMNYPRT
jgi:hypothetical protein